LFRRSIAWVFLSYDFGKVRCVVNCIILGDDIGLPVLMEICKQLNLQVCAYSISRGKSLSIETQQELVLMQYLDDPNSSQTRKFMRERKISLILVYSYNLILSKDFLSENRVKYLNIHGGKLPEYRGANVINWAIINGEKEIGVSIHEIIMEVDAGAVIAQWNVNIDDNDNARTMRDKLGLSIVSQAPPLISKYLNGELQASAQNEEKKRVWKRRTPEDGIFEWHWKDVEIYNMIRALVKPWPGARYFDRGGKLIVIDEMIGIDQIQKMRKDFSEV